MSAGYAITTYKIQLNYKHLDWFKQTQSLFDAVLAFYYQLLERQPEALELSNQNLLRHLELQTIPKRDGSQPETPLPYEKVPLYFRRGAINAAISLYRIYSGIHKACEEGAVKAQNPAGQNGCICLCAIIKACIKTLMIRALCSSSIPASPGRG